MFTYSAELTGERAKQYTKPPNVGTSNGNSSVSLVSNKGVLINFLPIHDDHKYGLFDSLKIKYNENCIIYTFKLF